MGLHFDPLQNKMVLEPAVPIQTITADTTLLSLTNLVYEIGTLTADITITTPALINGWSTKLLANNNTTYTVTISAASGKIYFGTMAGATSITLNNTYGGMYEIYCDGNDFYILESSTIGISGSGATANSIAMYDANIQKLVPATKFINFNSDLMNISIGTNIASSNIGKANTICGCYSLYSITTGNANTAIGVYSLQNITTGINNTAIGYGSGNGITTGSGNIIIGNNINNLPPNLTNNVIIGTYPIGIILQFDGTNWNFSGAINSNLITTLSGTTAGSVQWAQYFQGQFKAFAAQFIGYENNSTTSQTITFPTPFVNTPVIVANTTGLTITVTTTTLTIGAPNNTTTYSGIVKIEGF